MPRHFRVDASQKIQAAPVDFGMLDSMRPLLHDVALNLFEQHRESLIAYADAKFEEVANQINSDIKEIYSKYLYNNDSAIDEFLNILHELNCEINIQSNILNELRYHAYNDGNMLTELFVPRDDIEIETPDVGFILWIEEADIGDSLEVEHCDGSRFIEGGLEIIFCSAADDFYRKQVTADTLISTCQQIIYEYAEFVDAQFSRVLEDAVMKFFEGSQD